MPISQKPVNVDWDQDNEKWDMGFSALMEESPVINPFRKSQFHALEKKDGMYFYMNRRKPSWTGLSQRA